LSGLSTALAFPRGGLFLGLLALASPVMTQQPELTIPFDSGLSFRCSQGPGGSYSHTGVRTKYALDFAAPEGTRVLAAADGVAHIFPDEPDPSFKPMDCPTATSKNFGNHVTVDHGHGFFTIYAHLQMFAPNIDGKSVVRGEWLGTVDTTGWSCGNHLHFSLHSGTATNVGTSVSIPATSIRTIVAPQTTVSILSVSDFTCGPEGIGGSYQAPAAAGESPFMYQAFVGGNPGIPGDGIFVSTDSFSQFTLDAAIPLGGVNLLYLTVFPPSGMTPSNLAFSMAALNGPAVGGSPTCSAGQAVTIKGTVIVNGVNGFWGTISADDIAGDVAFIRSSLPGCDILVSDVSLTQLFVPLNSADSVKKLDAASISTVMPH
jgi:hypothetical protein